MHSNIIMLYLITNLITTFLPQHEVLPGNRIRGLNPDFDPSEKSAASIILAWSNSLGFSFLKTLHNASHCPSVPVNLVTSSNPIKGIHYVTVAALLLP